MFSKFMVFFLLLSLPLLAQENKDPAGFDPVADNFSEKYEGGPFLIYDCVDKHWVCVLESYYMACEKQRREDIDNKKQLLSCAPLGTYLNKKSCYQRQLYMVGQNYETRFCLHPDMKQKELKF
jgi:hypothetical protein